MQLLLCSFLTSKQNGRSRQFHAMAACLLKKPLIVTTKQESGVLQGQSRGSGKENNLLPLLGIKPRFLGHQSCSDNTDYATLVPLKHSVNCVSQGVVHDFYSSLIYRVQLSVAVPSSVTKMDYLGTGHFLSLDIMMYRIFSNLIRNFFRVSEG